MRSALAQTFNAIPVLAGTVTYIPHASQKGSLAVTAPWRTAQDALSVKDLRETDHPTYESLRSKHFPMADLDYSIIMPGRRSMHLPNFQALETDERPVLLAQINIINGGMILGLLMDHFFTDGVGSVTVAKVWASYCRGQDGSRLVSPECVDRTRLMEGDESGRFEDFLQYSCRPDPDISAPAHSFLSRMLTTPYSWIVRPLRSLFGFGLNAVPPPRTMLPSGPARDTTRSEPDPLGGEIFFFSQAKLKELKQMASKLESDETSWISTNDALACLVWSCVTAAYKDDNHNNLESTKDKSDPVQRYLGERASVLVFAINARGYLRPPLPAGFIGNVLIWGFSIGLLSTVVPTPEGVTKCAHSLRRDIKGYGDPTYIPRLIGGLKALPDISKVRLGGEVVLEHVFTVNSWATQEWYDLDWGQFAGGRCERVRVHNTLTENFCLVLPELKSDEGSENAAGLEVIIRIKERQMKSLRVNEFFNRFAEWRCS